MNLQAILQSKKLPPKQEEKEKKTEEYGDSFELENKFINSIETHNASYLTTPTEEEFLTALRIMVSHPYYQDTMGMRELFSFFTTKYVLNTFTKLDILPIFNLYMSLCKPRNPMQLHLLYIMLGDLELFIPSKYQSFIEGIIQKKFLDLEKFRC